MTVKHPRASGPGLGLPLGLALGSLVTAWELVGCGSLSTPISVSHRLHRDVGFGSWGEMRPERVLAVSVAGHAAISAFRLAWGVTCMGFFFFP